MKDLRKEAPTWAFINAQIIQRAFKKGDLDESIRHVENQYNLPPNSLSIMNSAYVVSLLYCMVLIPKELWLNKNKCDPIFDEIGNPSAFSQISLIDKTFDTDFDKHPAFYFIRHLRNALSHVRFSITNGPDFLFWDQKDENSPRNFEATMSLSNLEYFISIVGAKLANLRTRTDLAQD